MTDDESRLQIAYPRVTPSSTGSTSTASTASVEPGRRPRRGRTARAALAAIAAITTAIGALGGAAVANAAPTVTLTAEDVSLEVGEAHVAWPDGVAAAAFEVEGVAGAVGAAGDTGARPMASIAKLLFAAVLLDARPLEPDSPGPSIELDDRDVAHLTDTVRRGASVLPVAAGDVLTQRQLLEAALLKSAANATMTLADWAFGGAEGYVAAAERWLEERGIDGITVADSSGLSAHGVATTAGLLELMGAVDEQPVLREISGMTSTTLPRVGRVENTNEALGSAGVDSGKTGNLYAHGRTVLVGATREIGGVSVRIHVALLGIQRHVDRGAATAALVDSIVANLEWLSVLPAEAAVAQYEVPWARPVALETSSAVRLLHWLGTPVRVTVDAPREWDADASARLAVEVGGTVRTVPLEATGAPPTPSLETRLQHVVDVLLPPSA